MNALQKQYSLLAKYNFSMNQSMYQSCAALNVFELRKHRSAFFGSIINTLNHILVGDIIWLKRIANQELKLESIQEINNFETPNSLSQVLFDDFAILQQARMYIDSVFIALAEELTEQNLNSLMQYENTEGNIFKKRTSDVLLHVFNHQTHHRGQVSTLLSQIDIDYGSTDLIVLTDSFE